MSNITDWIREITEVVCPKCEEYYLLRDKYKRKRAKNITLDNGKKIRLGKIKKRDNLECFNCGVIRKYKKEKIIPMTEENYREWQISHGDLQYRNFKRKRKQNHLNRLHALKFFKTFDFNTQFFIDKLGYDNIMKGLMEGINRISFNLRISMLKSGSNRDRPNVPLLSFLIEELENEYTKKKSDVAI